MFPIVSLASGLTCIQSSSIHNFKSSAESSPSSNHTVKEAEERAQDFLNSWGPPDPAPEPSHGIGNSFLLASLCPKPTISGFARFAPGHPLNLEEPPQPAPWGCSKKQRTDEWGRDERANWGNADNSYRETLVSMFDETNTPEHKPQGELEPMSPNAGYTPTSPGFHSTCMYSSLPPSSSASVSEPTTPPQAHITEKKVECPPYDAAVVELLGGSNNTWVNTCLRPIAFDMWYAKEE